MNEIADRPFRVDQHPAMLSSGIGGFAWVSQEVEPMNHLLSGTALAAALAIAAPVWAQTPTTPNPAGTPSTTAPAAIYPVRTVHDVADCAVHDHANCALRAAGSSTADYSIS